MCAPDGGMRGRWVRNRQAPDTAGCRNDWTRSPGCLVAVEVRPGLQRRVAEAAKLLPVADLRTERDVNERAGEVAEKRIGSILT